MLVQVQTAHALTKTELSRTAQSITVLIQDANNPQSSGSGVMIKREGQSYTVLTAHHVIASNTTFRLMTPDGKRHQIIQSSIQTFPGVDLALATFKSSESYSISKMGDSSQSLLGTASFVAGFPGTTVVRSEPIFFFTSGEIAANASHPLKDGYALAYSNATLPGMSGGPVLNEQGELIGIHGRAESAVVPQNAQLRTDVFVLKTEFNYAIAINTFLNLAPKVNSALAFRLPSVTVAAATPKPDDLFLEADKQRRTGDDKRAIESFSQILRLNGNYGAAYTGRGLARADVGDNQGAVADYTQALRLNPTAGTYNNRGFSRYQRQDRQGAIADYDQAIRLEPNMAQAFNNRGLARFDLGDTQGAMADYTQAIRLSPTLAQAYNNRGFLRYGLQDIQGAIADYGYAIDANPSFAIAYNNRGLARFGARDLQTAIADYNQAIRLDPKQAIAYSNRGAAWFVSGDLPKAIADYDQALRLAPNTALAYYNRGTARFGLKDMEGAITDYEQAVRLDPNLAKALNNKPLAKAYNHRGLTRYILNDPKGSIAAFSKGLDLDPDFAEGYYNRGRMRESIGDKQGATSDFKKAADLFKAQGDQKGYSSATERLQRMGDR